ncbi:trna (guanine-n -)-methyltransferase : tRNA (guanine-N(7)-)-methyltransferase OS=Singulisphaera acidiphila (strain ATCC BAA-1392 / DSM 18658 / VKM B-2454 / MOB10) GN=trmB PE=3 SV=1: Methyltransf_4 [Tuwongella immobilis]|uniref:tRNA (guanine-N(7)-)-methyltransferase n=2 Tax=Tuwongella immobilis TaxID=692036 RepID=A0A6C2YPW4_9BACT|nr:trna (guanine-n -)-methyltransferase : tRNA (guanine-N(7)-)-methyltransferase OS=Singulisphaera acidiphila (strain ATCC BAA-1392 / DSM 18658 / VKM B-2454 / MOB10) GN=trmB PE=3 SV=1: Methyltransf_4 [Tuwongella immobilis]VTS04724.1 trna (guanine-n -)-methyltransferase : tRNA (guanine-N(7)-)-methyltransferase OS=Singulisphaera acidiphila (strain ATCC BAA-1392 / DSM 18658 / VKM B-2454 / MOB10) GN=trmB PE=3 SV=1: Methyltransf_4 [Tuwongella immobilis]
MFGNDHPVEIEVGFGKGAFLVSSAVARPDTNFFGIEIERKYQLLTAGRLASRGLSHVRVCAADAKQWFSQLIPPQSVAVVHVYFPDPWWKRRHHKRRLFTLDFAQDCLKVLKLDGVLSIATDVAEYFVMMQETLAQISEFSVIPLDPTIPGSNVETNFERKARMIGTPINRARYRKTAEAPPRPASSPEVVAESEVVADSAD